MRLCRIVGILLSCTWHTLLLGQDLMILGKVVDSEQGLPVSQALVYGFHSEDRPTYTQTDSNGFFELLLPRREAMDLIISHISYNSDTITVIAGEGPILFKLEKANNLLDEISVTASPVSRPMETPLSINSVDAAVIQKTPGSGSDIARVMLTLPGVTTTASFRNDLIIRGGAPSENAFYVDGFRVPTINHLATQGSSGGTISILNADLITNADLISGSFPANHDNALSSAFRFNLMDGNRDKLRTRFAIGANNMTLAANGPLGDQGSFVTSVGRSYRQYILKILGLAVYPVYNDFLLKTKFKTSMRNEVTLLGVGAIDKFRVNADVNSSEVQQYLVENLPENDQWNYTLGVKNRYFSKSGIWTITASRNELFNGANRDVTTNGSQETTLKYKSKEISHRFTSEYIHEFGFGTLRGGILGMQRRSEYDVFNYYFGSDGPVVADFNSTVDYWLYGGDLQFSVPIVANRWNISVGARIDGATYADQLNNPFNQISPRVATSIDLTAKLSINGSAGIYYQLPSDVTLAFKVQDTLANRNTVRYIRSNQYVLGAAYILPWYAVFKAELFRKDYSHYPFNTRDNISQANEGGQFGVAGNSPIVSTGTGVAEGFEMMYHQDFYKGWFGKLSYTYSRSEFADLNNRVIPSTWDTRHITNLLAGKRFSKNRQLGLNLRYQSAPPYTPFDLTTSSLVTVWNINREGVRDYSQLNSLRGKPTIFIDLRADKTWDLPWGKFTFYIDLENLLADADSQQVLVLDKTDSSGNPTSDAVILNPQDRPEAQRYKVKEIRNAEGVLIPTFGFILDL